jgi:protein-tyrosine phosphatase
MQISSVPMPMPQRHLAWDACMNIRDVGGYPTTDGRETRWRALVRADNLCRLTREGQAALIAYGVRTIIDLRSANELESEPHPFGAKANGSITYRHLPLLDSADEALSEAMKAAGTAAKNLLVWYRMCRPQLARIVEGVAEADQGGLLIHCHAGKDRTGFVVAMLLALAGVTPQSIADDYALSDTYLQPMFEDILAKADAEKREQIADSMASRADAMLTLLSSIEREHGGVRGYLRDCGVQPAALERVRERLRD